MTDASAVASCIASHVSHARVPWLGQTVSVAIVAKVVRAAFNFDLGIISVPQLNGARDIRHYGLGMIPP